MADDDVAEAGGGERTEGRGDLVDGAPGGDLGAEAAVTGSEDRLDHAVCVLGRLPDEDVEAHGHGAGGLATGGAAPAIVRGLAGGLLERDPGCAEPAVGHAGGALDGNV